MDNWIGFVRYCRTLEFGPSLKLVRVVAYNNDTHLNIREVAMGEQMKTCSKCRNEKAVSEFYAHPAARDGLQTRCKECYAAYARSVRGRQAQAAFTRSAKGRQAHRSATSQWNAVHPEALRAQHALTNALATGKIVRQPCKICGSANSHGHHEDYSKPLEVRWLCSLHHAQIRGEGEQVAPNNAIQVR